MALTPFCAFLAANSAIGEWANLSDSDESKPVVDATFIRKLLLGLPISKSEHEQIHARHPDYAPHLPSGDAAPVPIASAGVRLRGATVKGFVDLADCCGVGDLGMPALALENCILKGGSDTADDPEHEDYLPCLDLSRSRIARLSLKDSRFGFVRAQEAVIDGGVDLSGVQPVEGWTFPGMPGADMAAFRAAMRTDDDWPADRAGEPITEQGATASSQSRPACCWADFTGCKIGGEFIAISSRFRTPPARDEKNYHFMDTRYGLKLTQATIGGSLIAFGEKVGDTGSIFDGGLNLHLAEIRGEVWLGGVRLIKGEGSALDAQGSTLGGVFATGSALKAFGSIYFNSARVSRRFHLKGADLDGDYGSALQANGLTVGGDFLLDGINEAGNDEKEKGVLAAHGPVRLEGAHIGGCLAMEGALIHGMGTEAFNGSFIRVGSELRLTGVRARGCIVLRNASAGDTLHLEGTVLRHSVEEKHNKGNVPDHMLTNAISAEDAEIGDSVLMEETVANGRLSFERVQTDKDFTVVKSHICALEADADAIDLGWSRIGGALKFKDNKKIFGVLRLTHASARILHDNEGGYDDATHVELDGFRYQSLSRCDWTAGDGDLPEQARKSIGCAKARADWLKRRQKFKPQPYAQLARVLAGQGQPEDAREILIEKQYQELESRKEVIGELGFRQSLPLRVNCWASGLFGRLFGFGLKPLAAIRTIFLAFLLGWIGTIAANERGAMIVEQQPIAGSVQGTQLGAARSAGSVADRLPCAHNIDPALYALDVFIPLVDLRQESKCEVGEAIGARIRLLPGFRLTAAELAFYRLSKVGYAIAGWLIISLAILTFSGVLERRAER